MAMKIEDAAALLKITKELNALSKIEIDNSKLRKDAERQISEIIQMQSDRLSTINEIKKSGIVLTGQELADFDAINDAYNEQIVTLRKLINDQKTHNALLKDEVKTRGVILDLAKSLGSYLMTQDKIIKSTILNLGMSGTKADLMRTSFEKSAGYVTALGGNLEDIQKIMEGFGDETGRARVLSSEMVKDITDIGRGTGLGIEQATKLASQFEFMGLDAKNTMNFVQGIVDTSERMGVNTTKVLKTVNDNFKKINTFTFQKGSKGIAEMAMNAEKTQVSLATALNVAEATRGLDQVIELGANLQVMGGEFAKMNPFQWLYISRNEPEKMTEKISEMTKGIFTLKKNSDGVFERFISPEDRDRLANVAKSLGITNEEMFKIGQRRLDLSLLNKQTAGMGLSDKEKESIQGAAILNSTTGKFQVSLAGTMRDIGSLTKDQAKAFASEQVLLSKRATEALTFDEAFKNTINSLKSALLPLLSIVNWTLEKLAKPIKWLTELSGSGWGGMVTAAGILLTGALVWKGVIGGLGSLISKGGAGISGAIGGMFGKKPQLPPATAPAGGGTFGGGAGGTALGIGAGIGAAALGTGAGVGAAAAGISLLADAMSKLDVEKAKILQNIVITIGAVTTLGIAAAAALMFASTAIGTFGAVAATASIGIGMLAIALTPIGVAVLAIGAGVGLATAGIGYMFTGIGNLVTGVGNLVTSFSNLKISSETLTAIKAIALSAPDFKIVGDSFANISAALSGSKDDWVAVQNAITAISGANISGGGMLAELANLLRSPLKVEFADKNVAVVSNITMEIDGEKIFQKTYRPVAAVEANYLAKALGMVRPK